MSGDKQPFKITNISGLPKNAMLIEKGDVAPRLWNTLFNALRGVLHLDSEKEYDFWILVAEKEVKP